MCCALPGGSSLYSRLRIFTVSLYAKAETENWIRVTSVGNDTASAIDFGSGSCSRPSLHFRLDRLWAMTWRGITDTAAIARVVCNKGTEFICDFTYEAQLFQQGCLPAFGFSKLEAEELGYHLVSDPPSHCEDDERSPEDPMWQT